MSGEPLPVIWGRILRETRKAAGLTQVQLARRIDTFQEHISRWENGRYAPSDEMRPRLAHALGVPIADLFPYPDDTNGDEAAA